ncbi:MAG: alpha/beta fold hydrolase [Oligoflexales bacterium]
MKLHGYHKQLQTVIAIELILIVGGFFLAKNFWEHTCNATLLTCLAEKNLPLQSFLLLNIIRPFLLTPIPIFAMMAGSTFGPIKGTVLAALGATLSCVAVYLLAKAIGKRLVNPWLSSNLPQTLRFIRSQDWKIVLVCRLVPIIPFDLCTLIFGLLDFRWKYVILVTFVAIIPESYLFSIIATQDSTVFSVTVTTLSVIIIFCILPGFIIEFISRKKGSSLWVRLKAMWIELKEEVKYNNEIVKRHQHNPAKIPILLVYGYFSSRRALTVLERILTRQGYEVISFNLGGLLGVFFTKGIKDTANFIDFKLKRQFDRHKFDKVTIVAHSKGGLVALWWVLKLGGSKYCHKVITMGTPFKGSLLTWLALVTPIGLVFKDLWQMRPGSDLLKDLHNSEIPRDVRIFNLFSNKDRVARGEHGLFKPRTKSTSVVPIPMHHVTHFEFLYRRDVGDALINILGSPYLDTVHDKSKASYKID